ncbi:MAG: hypothetical protein ACJAUJ_000903 [Salibacteraceae bacterium]|jgi:hypothetical protein
MHINKEILFTRLQKFIEVKYKQNDKELVLEICHKIIFNSPTVKPGKSRKLNYLSQMSVDTTNHVITDIGADFADQKKPCF